MQRASVEEWEELNKKEEKIINKVAMRVYIGNVYTYGLIVVKTVNRESAIELISQELDLHNDTEFNNTISNFREIEGNEVYYVSWII